MKSITTFIFVFTCFYVSQSQENWLIDNPHSNIRFEVGWEDFSMRTGEFKVFNGSMVTNSREDLSDATFEMTVDASSVDVIAERLAGHIKSDRFLDVENYPEITFASHKVTKKDGDSYVATGKLMIHGVEKEQEVSFEYKGAKETKKGYIMGLKVTLLVDKTDYGLDWGSPRLADQIKLVGHLLYKLQVEEEEE